MYLTNTEALLQTVSEEHERHKEEGHEVHDEELEENGNIQQCPVHGK